MKSKNKILSGLLIILVILSFSMVLPACTSHKKINAQKRGLMIEDRSKYSKNRKHYKGPKKHKSQARKMKKNPLSF